MREAQKTEGRIDVCVGPTNEEKLQEWRGHEAAFVLITEIRDHQALRDKQMLHFNKEQQVLVPNRVGFSRPSVLGLTVATISGAIQ